MSAAEIIKEIKALPPQEQAQIVEFVKEMDGGQSAVSYMDKETFEAAADKVFTKHSELLRKLAS